MPFTIACADGGANCPASFTTETKEELFQHVMMHGERNHPEMIADPNASAMLERLVRAS